DRGVCALPFTRQSDQQTVYIPMNIIGNLYVSNGMSAGNTANEARVQGLSEVFERYVKNRIIAESISLPAIPDEVLNRYPGVGEAIAKLEE
ncbi:YcaO-like family protein, partial [Paenibacillus polymyxa]|nr:YcaO-like family protein [Paenibacillus polymyxa]